MANTDFTLRVETGPLLAALLVAAPELREVKERLASAPFLAGSDCVELAERMDEALTRIADAVTIARRGT